MTQHCRKVVTADAGRRAGIMDHALEPAFPLRAAMAATSIPKEVRRNRTLGTSTKFGAVHHEFSGGAGRDIEGVERHRVWSEEQKCPIPNYADFTLSINLETSSFSEIECWEIFSAARKTSVAALSAAAADLFTSSMLIVT